MSSTQKLEHALEDESLDGQRLYLFSSNVRRLYTQNIMDLIAAPEGQITTFRYGEEWLNAAAKNHWSNLTNVPVLIHFSLQHESEYFEPALIPIRLGRVVRSTEEGSFRFVDVELGEDVSLSWNPHELPQWKRDSRRFLPTLPKYRQFLDRHGVTRPYSGSATLDRDIFLEADGLIEQGLGSVEHFRRHAEFLVRTEVFESAIFLRALRLVESSDETPVPISTTETGRPVFRLKGGTSYYLDLFAFQPRTPPSISAFSATVDNEDAIRIIGRHTIEISSEYDRPRITLHTGHAGGGQTLNTELAVTPQTDVMGPTVNLQFVVEPSASDKALNLLAPLAVLVPIAGASFAPEPLWRFILAGIGIFVAIGLQWYGIAASNLIGVTTSNIRPSAPDAELD